MTRRKLPLLLLLFAGVLLASAAFAQEGEATVEEYIVDGRLFLVSGECELAQYYYREALKLEPDNAEALVGNGRALACRNNYPLAIEAFQDAIEVEPENSEAYVHLALAFQDQYLSDPERDPNRVSEALSTLEVAENYSPENPRVLNAKGVIQFQMGNLQAARGSLEEAIALATAQNSDLGPTERSVIHVNLGKTYRDLGELDRARNTLRRAVVLDPRSSSAHNNLGFVHFRMGDCEEAEYELSQAASLDPSSLSAVSQLAITLFECGNTVGSIPHFEQALELNGAVFNPPLYTYLARAYAQQGRYDEAVFRAQQGALLQPQTADAYYHLGAILLQRNQDSDTEDARAAFEQALTLDPSHGSARQALSNL